MLKVFVQNDRLFVCAPVKLRSVFSFPAHRRAADRGVRDSEEKWRDPRYLSWSPVLCNEFLAVRIASPCVLKGSTTLHKPPERQYIYIRCKIRFIYNTLKMNDSRLRQTRGRSVVYLLRRTTITPAQTLAPNDIKSTRWWHLYPERFSLICVQWKEVKLYRLSLYTGYGFNWVYIIYIVSNVTGATNAQN